LGREKTRSLLYTSRPPQSEDLLEDEDEEAHDPSSSVGFGLPSDPFPRESPDEHEEEQSHELERDEVESGDSDSDHRNEHGYISGNNVFDKVCKKSIFLRELAYLHQFQLDGLIFEAYTRTAHEEVVAAY
jgi:hypothetical protein